MTDLRLGELTERTETAATAAAAATTVASIATNAGMARLSPPPHIQRGVRQHGSMAVVPSTVPMETSGWTETRENLAAAPFPVVPSYL